MASGFDLPSLLSQLQQGGNAEDKTCMWKKLLYQVVSTTFTDLSKVCEKQVASQLDVTLDFVGHMISVCPQVFVRCANLGDDTGQPADVVAETEQEKACSALTTWVVTHLLRLLSVCRSDVIRDKTQRLLHTLLIMLKSKSPYFFRRILTQFICSLADLAILNDSFYGECAEDHKVELHRFQCQHASVTSPPTGHPAIVLSSPESCDLLQIAISRLLDQVSVDLCEVSLNGSSFHDCTDVSVLWSTICHQLEYGEVQLKTVSLNLSASLFRCGSLPLAQQHDSLAECLVALTTLLLSGFNDVDGDYVALETSLASMLHILVDSTVCHQVSLRLIEDVCHALLTYGMAALRTSQLSAAVCCVLTHRSHMSMELRSALTRRLVMDIGVHGNMQCLRSYLCSCVMRERSHNSSDNCGTTAKRRKTGGETKESVDDNLLPREEAITLRLLNDRLQTLCAQLQDDHRSDEELHDRTLLGGVKLIVDVITWSTVQFKEQSICSIDVIQSLAKTFRHILSRCARVVQLSSEFSVSLGLICDTITAIVLMNDVIQCPMDLSHAFISMTSLPWITAGTTWMDLKVDNKTEFISLAAALKERIDDTTVGKCVRVLSHFTNDVAFKWRSHVLNLTMTDKREVIRVAAIRCFCRFLHFSGPNCQHLVHNLITAAVKDKCGLVQQELADAVGPLMCVLSGNATYRRNNCIHRHEQSDWLELHCSSCDSDEQKPDATSNKSIDADLFLPFLTVLKTEDKQVTLKFIGGLRRLFGHLSIRCANPTTSKILQTCLQLIDHKDHSVRLAFSTVIQHIVGCELKEEGSSNSDSVIVSRLRMAAKAARQSCNSALMESILLTVGQLGRVAQGDLLLVMIIILLDTVCSPSCRLAAAVAHQQLKNIGEGNKVKMRHLFVMFGRSICKVLVEHMHDAQQSSVGVDPLEMLREISSVFEFSSVKDFLQRSQHLLLPHLVKKASPTASILIRLVAKQLGDPNHKGPLVRNIRHIFCHLVCSCQPDELIKTCAYLESASEWDLVALLKCGQNVDSELLLHLASSYDQVLTGFKILLSKSSKQNWSRENISKTHLADLLQPKLLGVLVHFDNHLNNSNIPLAEKKQTCESIIALMKLMGSKHITTVRMRMMTTLKICMKITEKGFPEICCHAWDCFVRSLDVSTLGPMLSQIAVNLLPLLQHLPNQVADVLTYLIVQNRKSLHEHFRELYFLPDIPEMAAVNRVIKTYTKDSGSGADLKSQMTHLLRGIKQESRDVKQLALTKFKALLHSNQDSLHRLVLDSETVDPIISETVTTLLSGCRESDQDTRCLYGECLGELGAIDPGRLPLMASCGKEDLSRFQASINDDNFVFCLINELVKAFLRAKERNTQDCVAFAIQELLQIYEIDNAPNSMSSRANLWRKFSEEAQEILTPLMHSRYMLTVHSNWSQLAKPIYRSRKGSKFEHWVCTLTAYLSSKVQQSKAKKVFDSCRGVIKNDSQMALYLLPQIIVQVLLDGKQEDQAEINVEILAVLEHVSEPDTRRGHGSDLRNMCAQTVFSVLDHLTRWCRHRVLMLSTGSGARRTAGSSAEVRHLADPSYKLVSGFLSTIRQDVLALASYNCGAYTRALMHYEKFIDSGHTADAGNTGVISNHLDFLQKIYIALDEPDGVTGIITIKQTPPTLSEQIVAFESIGQLSDASVCYDRAIQLEPDEISHRQGYLRSRLALGELQSAHDLANAMIAEDSSRCAALNAYRIEATWKLGQWDNLESYLRLEDNSRNWNVGLGKILLAAKCKDEDEYLKQLRLVRNDLMTPLSAASMEIGSYHRGYEHIVRLHMLNEIEQGFRSLMDFPSAATRGRCNAAVAMLQSCEPVSYKQLLDHWSSRLQCLQSSFRVQEPLLSLRRIVLGLSGILGSGEPAIGECWLKLASVARKSGLVQTAHSSLLSASDYNLPEFCIERAKWLWHRGDYDKAQSCLEKALEQHYPDREKLKATSSAETRPKRLACAKVLLLLGRYCEETSSQESNTIVRRYKEVMRVCGDWEQAHFHIAKYYDKIMTTLVEPDRPEKKGEFVLLVVQYFGQSLLHGHQFIYQSMPRLLSLWLDYGSEVSECEVRSKNDAQLTAVRTVLENLNKSISTYCVKLPPYQFLTAFPQLISRICHMQTAVFTQLKEIIAKLLNAFPQQAMWMMMAVSKSSYQMRVKRCQEIFNRAKSTNRDLHKFLQDATKLTERLLDLCNKNIEGSTSTLSLTQHFKPLKRLFDDRDFSSIALPLQSQMTVTLPSMAVPSSAQHPFSTQLVHISGIEDTIEVLPSLQKPKKITMLGSDGRFYVMLCKPKDDLRKDARLMEFNAIVNKCLRKDAESRRRDLLIRTFTVTPLNEECGLLEWVSNTSGIRHILLKLYKERGLHMSGKELKSMQLPPGAPLAKKLDIFLNKLLPRHPPVFSEWFLNTFPDPTSWYNARLSYCRTTAVMSMVGYMLGLGDRHGENILLDSTNGDCVHVDFNCLFNKGETFDYPEIVPFRLTHNMVKAMGPMKYEGIFRRSCEVTMRVMRNESDSLMSVLKTFIYDPLVEWSKPSRGRSAPESGEIKNEQGQTHVNNIEFRLKGVLKNKTKPFGLPLSVEGHVDHLIKEATSDKNLCEMYLGWASYM